MARAMSESTDVDQVRVRYDALLAGNVSAAAVVLDDASVLHVPGKLGVAGDYQGEDAIFGVLGRMAEYTHDTLKLGSPRLVVCWFYGVTSVPRPRDRSSTRTSSTPYRSEATRSRKRGSSASIRMHLTSSGPVVDAPVSVRDQPSMAGTGIIS